MLRKNQKALQVLIFVKLDKKLDANWEYVFCYSKNEGKIITTKDRKKALNAAYDLDWFAEKFGNHSFRSEPE